MFGENSDQTFFFALRVSTVSAFHLRLNPDFINSLRRKDMTDPSYMINFYFFVASVTNGNLGLFRKQKTYARKTWRKSNATDITVHQRKMPYSDRGPHIS
jgi:hypothetical protein